VASAPPGVITATPSEARPPSPALDGSGAVLATPSTASPRAIDKAKGCNSANDPGWKIVECGALKTEGTVLLWVIEGRGRGLRALALREQTANQWVVVAAAADDDGTRFTRIGVRGEDLAGDGHPELVFGFHRVGSDKIVAMDVVDHAARVVVHRELPQGAARLAKGELGTWSATGDASGEFEHATIKFSTGAWRVAGTERVARTAVPPSMI
jgi:hypothetical protein